MVARREPAIKPSTLWNVTIRALRAFSGSMTIRRPKATAGGSRAAAIATPAIPSGIPFVIKNIAEDQRL